MQSRIGYFMMGLSVAYLFQSVLQKEGESARAKAVADESESQQRDRPQSR